jgi:predicted MFS family arabinose efflux permease
MVGVGGAVGVIISGILADLIGPQMTIAWSAVFFIPAIFLYLRIKN